MLRGLRYFVTFRESINLLLWKFSASYLEYGALAILFSLGLDAHYRLGFGVLQLLLETPLFELRFILLIAMSFLSKLSLKSP